MQLKKTFFFWGGLIKRKLRKIKFQMFDDEEVLKYHRSNNTLKSAIITERENIYIKRCFIQPSCTSSLNISWNIIFLWEFHNNISLWFFAIFFYTDGFLSWLPTRIYIKRINKNNKKKVSMRGKSKKLTLLFWGWDPLHLTLFHFSYWSNGLLHGIFFP